MKKLLVLSGGQDSVTCLYQAKVNTPDVELSAITFDYGQRHSVEVQAARWIAKMAKIPHEVVEVPDVLKGGTLLGGELDTYKNYDAMVDEVGDRIEATYVPVRNMFFLTTAANRALAQGISTIITGVCGSDTANYPDCTEPFIRAAEKALRLASGNQSFSIEAPLVDKSKKQIVHIAWALGGAAWDALSYSHTAYSGKIGTKDHSSLLRAKGFEEAGLPDPMIVRAWKERKILALPKTGNYDEKSVQETLNLLSERSDYA